MTKAFFLFISILTLISLIFLVLLDEAESKLIAFLYTIVFFFSSIFFFFKVDFSKLFLSSFYIKIFDFFQIYMYLGIDSLSIIFILLMSFLFPLVVLSSWDLIRFNIKSFFFNIIVLEFILFMVFLSFDLLFFYVWFEASLIPMFFIIAIWGSQTRKILASFYLLGYTVIFSVGFLFCILYLNSIYGTTNITFLKTVVFSRNQQLFLGFFFFLAFAVKMPLFPFHLWLPEAHVEAPTPGSIILAGLLLKLGYFGFIRFFVGVFPLALEFYRPMFSMLSILGCIYGSCLALSQDDIKKTIAYSSVAHMSLAMLGIISNNIFGLVGSYLIAIGHTFVSSGLFALVGMLYNRYHTRIIDYYSGLNLILPLFSFMFFYFIISNFSFPLSLNFIAEVLTLIGVGFWNFNIVFILIIYSVLCSAFCLWLYVRICHGALRDVLILRKMYFDLSKKEIFILFPLFFLSLFLCFFPSTLVNVILFHFMSIIK